MSVFTNQDEMLDEARSLLLGKANSEAERTKIDGWFNFEGKDKLLHAFEKLCQLRNDVSRVSLEDVRSVSTVVKRGTLRVFISYRHALMADTKAIIGILRELFRHDRQIEIIWDEGFDVGQPLTHQVIDTILSCQIFLLLLPDRSQDWDWILYESGVFMARNNSPLQKVVILHHSLNPAPPQFRHLLTVRTDPNDTTQLASFLNKLCLGEDYFPGMGSLCPNVTKSSIEKAAKRIAELIAPRRKLKRCQPFLKLSVTAPDYSLENAVNVSVDGWRAILTTAVIKEGDINSKCRDLFGVPDYEGDLGWTELLTPA